MEVVIEIGGDKAEGVIKINFIDCLRITIAVMKCHGQKQCGEERVILLIFSHCSSSSKEVRAGIQTGKEPAGRS